MDKYIICVFLFVNIANINIAVKPPTEDYCWRDFKGIVPADALSAGFDEHGKPIYIGQVLFGDKLIPGRIHEDDKNIYYEFGEQAWSVDENIKIFCTKHPENFEWVSTTYEEVPNLSNVIIKGGFESRFPSYIGRKTINGNNNVGKVICSRIDCLALYVNENGKYVQYKTFHILTYNPNLQLQ